MNNDMYWKLIAEIQRLKMERDFMFQRAVIALTDDPKRKEELKAAHARRIQAKSNSGRS